MKRYHVDVALFRWVQRFTPLLIDASRPQWHTVGDRSYVDETYVKVNGVWRCLYRAVDQYGQVNDVLVSPRTDFSSARRFFATSFTAHGALRSTRTGRTPWRT